MTAPRPPWGPVRVAAWAAVAALAALWVGPQFARSFRPGENTFTDFVQEWLSAKNYRAGIPVYAPQMETFPRHTGVTPELSQDFLLWNAHPPVTVLLGLPFTDLSYRDAHFVWNIVSLVLFGMALALVIRELGVPFRGASLLPLVALCLLSNPLQAQFFQGQLNALLLLLLVLAWIADRRGRIGWAGAALGCAAAIKLVPAFLFLYFLCTRRWKALGTGAVAFVALNAVAVGVLGTDAYRDYVRVVIPGVTKRYLTFWPNVSLTGFWLRLLDPDPRYAAPLVRAPLLAALIANGLRLVVVLVTARACWRAATRGERDRAFGIALVAMLLVSPLAWTHYYLLLLVPLGLLWLHLPPGRARWVMWAVLLVMWLPEVTFMRAAVDGPRLIVITRAEEPPMTAAENLAITSAPHLALLGFFLLTLLVRVPPGPEPGAEGAAPSASG